jgi:anhydro-N-acetylmuramic acid kinase
MKQTTTVIGIMSGTSLDGLDIAYCQFSKEPERWTFSISDAKCVHYSPEWRERFSTAHALSGIELTALDAHFGRFIAQQVNDFLKGTGLPKPDLIASHGHTVFHAPAAGYTLQVGSGAHIAAATGITTVNDFRSMDVALGGQGAPLVPVGDALLFGNYAACLNLGGFSNISFDSHGERTAFDICPVNIVMNPLAEILGQPFDRDGALAASGSIMPQLLEQLNGLSIYHTKKRPSLSREWLEAEVLPLIPSEKRTEDVLRTFAEHSAQQMAIVLNTLSGAREVLLTGGGAYNRFLVERLRSLTPMTIVVPDSIIVEFKEAVIFAFLGVLRMRRETNVLRSVTGAISDSCSGAVHL